MPTSKLAATGVALGIALLVACGGAIPAAVQFVDTIPTQPRIGDITTVRFRAIDAQGLSMGGAELHFSIPDGGMTGGITLNPTSALTNKGDGIGSTQIIASGSRVSSVVIEARAGPLVALSPPITFSGANSPNGKQFTFQCGTVAGEASGGVHALGAYDESRYLIAGVKVDCFAHVGDRNGTGIPNALVSFMTEAGTIGASGISVTDVIGNADILYKTSLPLPKDVTPSFFTFDAGVPLPLTKTDTLIAPNWMMPFNWSENPIADMVAAIPANGKEPWRPDGIRPNIINNPRDNLVAMIAVTAGEEGYVDENNNGRWDPNEPFDDLTEPFVDSNDNGMYDPDERWIDTNNSGSFNGKNGAWDGNTLIWVQERILWTGIPSERDRNDATYPVFRQTSGVAAAITHFGNANYDFAMADPWFNTMAQNGDADGCRIPGIDGEKLVNLNQTAFGVGKRMTYPAFNLIRAIVSDAHNPLKTPPDGPYVNGAGTPTPIGFQVPAVCTFTASPIAGHAVSMALILTGTVL